MLVALWGKPFAPRQLLQVVLEAVLIGCSISWLSTRFFASAASHFSNGLAIHFFCCLGFSLHTVTFAITVWGTRNLGSICSAVCISLNSGLIEAVQALALGFTWIGLHSSLSVANTPIVQFVSVLTCFGLSTILCFVGVLILPNLLLEGWSRWIRTVGAVSIFLSLWLGGKIIESRISVDPLSFAAMMVQPNEGDAKSGNVHTMTVQSLMKDGPLDLIVWPEGSVQGESYSTYSGSIETLPPSILEKHRLQISELRSLVASEYHTNTLVGATVIDQLSVDHNGQEFLVDKSFNCGCLIDKTADVDCHEKRMLVPVVETADGWLGWLPWIRELVLSPNELRSAYQPGRNFHPLSFTDHSGATCRIAVAICYESWFPWLPQYHCEEPLDAICHLAYDGDFKDHPEYTQRMLLTIRLRAIETRTWQLVCSHYAGTAVIDPRGRIVKQLPPGPGVLRTDQL
jgi:apolipoprotein N-acyltransferase